LKAQNGWGGVGRLKKRLRGRDLEYGNLSTKKGGRNESGQFGGKGERRVEAGPARVTTVPMGKRGAPDLQGTEKKRDRRSGKRNRKRTQHLWGGKLLQTSIIGKARKNYSR